MNNITKCKIAQAIGCRVQCKWGTYWREGDDWVFNAHENSYRIHPEDENKFLKDLKAFVDKELQGCNKVTDEQTDDHCGVVSVTD